MTRTLACASAAFLAVTALSVAPASAHHSGAMFDSAREVELTGTIREFRWSNPHAWIEIDVPAGGVHELGVEGEPISHDEADDAGANDEATLWAIEMNPPAMLVRNGWRRSSLSPGDEITLVINPLRDGQPGGTIVRAVLADGAVLEGRSR